MKKEERFKVPGMVCEGCVDTVNYAIKTLDGIEKVKVQLDNKEVFVIFDAKSISLNEIKEAVLKSGYKPD